MRLLRSEKVRKHKTLFLLAIVGALLFAVIFAVSTGKGLSGSDSFVDQLDDNMDELISELEHLRAGRLSFTGEVEVFAYSNGRYNTSTQIKTVPRAGRIVSLAKSIESDIRSLPFDLVVELAADQSKADDWVSRVEGRHQEFYERFLELHEDIRIDCAHQPEKYVFELESDPFARPFKQVSIVDGKLIFSSDEQGGYVLKELLDFNMDAWRESVKQMIEEFAPGSTN